MGEVEKVVELPFLGGKITPQEWLAGYAGDDRKGKANARAEEGERVAAYITWIQARNEQLEAQLAEARAALKWAISNINAPRLIRGQNNAHFAAYQAAIRALTPGCEHQTGPIGDAG